MVGQVIITAGTDCSSIFSFSLIDTGYLIFSKPVFVENPPIVIFSYCNKKIQLGENER